jgi:hypothetical protein
MCPELHRYKLFNPLWHPVDWWSGLGPEAQAAWTGVLIAIFAALLTAVAVVVEWRRRVRERTLKTRIHLLLITPQIATLSGRLMLLARMLRKEDMSVLVSSNDADMKHVSKLLQIEVPAKMFDRETLGDIDEAVAVLLAGLLRDISGFNINVEFAATFDYERHAFIESEGLVDAFFEVCDDLDGAIDAMAQHVPSIKHFKHWPAKSIAELKAERAEDES